MKPPLPPDFDIGILRKVANKWQHLSRARRLRFYRNHKAHVLGIRRNGYWATS